MALDNEEREYTTDIEHYALLSTSNSISLLQHKYHKTSKNIRMNKK